MRSYIDMSRSWIRFSFISTFLLLPSILGRTPHVACFKPYLQAKTQLSDTHLSLTYTIGTLIASLCVPYITYRLKSKFPFGKLLRGSYIILIGCLLGLIHITVNFNSVPWIFVSLCLVFTGIRLCGQGLLPLCIRTLTATQYDANTCAWIASLHTTLLILITGTISFGLTYTTLLQRWQWLWSVEIIFLIFIYLCIPEKLPNMIANGNGTTLPSPNAWRLKNLPMSYKWALGVIALHHFQATALVFHIADFANENKVPLSLVYQLFLPIAILEIIFNPVSAWLINRIQLTTIPCLTLNLMAINVGIFYFSYALGRSFFVIFCALGWSLNHILSYRVPASLLTKEQLPLGFATLIGWTSLCSALSPYLYSLLASINGSYRATNACMLIINSAVLLAYNYRGKFL